MSGTMASNIQWNAVRKEIEAKRAKISHRRLKKMNRIPCSRENGAPIMVTRTAGPRWSSLGNHEHQEKD